MKFLLFLFAFILLALTAVSAPVILADFSTEQPNVTLHKPKEKAQKASYAELAGGRRGLRCDWDNSCAYYTEFAIGKRMELPSFDEAEVIVEAYLPPECPIRSLNIRLRDRDGEMFQLFYRIPSVTPGWQRFRYKIDAEATYTGTWNGGKKANRKLDFPVVFVGLAAEFNSKSGTGFLGIGSISAEVVSAPPEIEFHSGSGTPIHTLKEGEESSLAFSIRNRRPEPAVLEGECIVTDLWDRPVSKQKFRAGLAPGEQHKIALSAPSAYGVYRLQLAFQEQSGGRNVARSHVLSFCYMRPSGPTPGWNEGFLFGICTHLRGKPLHDQEREVMALAWCGAKVVRDDISWGWVMQTPASWDLDKYYAFRGLLERAGVELAPILQYPPAWAKPEGWKSRRKGGRGHFPPELVPWGEFCRKIAGALRGKVRFIEIWNEPDHPGFADFTGEEYVELLNTAYRNIKEAAPEIQVVSGGLSGLISREQIGLFEKIVKNGSFDIPAFHGHGPLDSYRHQVSVLRKQTGKPWYANETAQSALHIGELGQAAVLFRKFLYSWAHGAMGYNWYDIRNDGTDPKENEHNFGLITWYFQPKAAYVAYNALAGAYRNATFEADARLGSPLEGYWFLNSEGTRQLAFWNNNPSAGSRVLCLESVSGPVTHIDLFGNETRLPVKEGQLIFDPGKLPGTLRFEKAEKTPKAAGELISLVDPFLTTGGGTQEFKLRLFNPTGRRLTFELVLHCPEGLAGKFEKNKITVDPKKTATATARVTAAAGFRSPEKEPAMLTVVAAVGGVWKGTVSYPAHNAVVLPPSGFSERGDFALDKPSQVTILARNAPDTAHLFWFGPKDLSATVRLGRDGENLLLKAEVTDDIHCQPYSDGQIYVGDSIQLALQLPDQPSLWEIGLARKDDGGNVTHVWMAPDRFDPPAVAQMIELRTNRDEAKKRTVYEAKIPFRAIGMTVGIGQRGFRFNLIVNDNDRGGRESYIGIAPGIGENKDPQFYPVVRFRK